MNKQSIAERFHGRDQGRVLSLLGKVECHDPEVCHAFQEEAADCESVMDWADWMARLESVAAPWRNCNCC
jgi:hypothetical protein